MHLFYRLGLGLLLVALAAPALHAQALPWQSSRTIDRDIAEFRARVTQEVTAVLDAWEEAWERQDARALAQLYSEDASLILTSSGMVRGRAEIQRALEQIVPKVGAMSAGISDLTVSDGAAVVVVQYQYTSAASRTSLNVGSYVAAFRQERGRWRIRMQMFNNEASPAE